MSIDPPTVLANIIPSDPTNKLTVSLRVCGYFQISKHGVFTTDCSSHSKYGCIEEFVAIINTFIRKFFGVDVIQPLSGHFLLKRILLPFTRFSVKGPCLLNVFPIILSEYSRALFHIKVASRYSLYLQRAHYDHSIYNLCL